MKTRVLNFIAGPGAGKSTMAADVFSQLKWMGVKTELVGEFAKDLVWEERFNTLPNQLYILGKQFHRLYRLLDKVDVIITDSPIILSAYYANEEKMPKGFNEFVLNAFNYFDNHTYFVKREKPYRKEGRLQGSLAEAVQIDIDLENMLMKYQIPYVPIAGNHENATKIANFMALVCGYEKKVQP